MKNVALIFALLLSIISAIRTDAQDSMNVSLELILETEWDHEISGKELNLFLTGLMYEDIGVLISDLDVHENPIPIDTILWNERIRTHLVDEYHMQWSTSWQNL